MAHGLTKIIFLAIFKENRLLFANYIWLYIVGTISDDQENAFGKPGFRPKIERHR